VTGCCEYGDEHLGLEPWSQLVNQDGLEISRVVN
jgi:hypothetical protein